MTVRRGRAALVGLAIFGLAACGSGGSDEPGGATPGPAEASAPAAGEASTSPEPSPAVAEDLEPLLLDIADVPTGGWRLEPDTVDEAEVSEGEVSTDKKSLGPCFLELEDSMPDFEERPHAERGFVRDDAYLNQSVVRGLDPQQVVEQFEDVMAECEKPMTGTSEGQSVWVRSEAVEPSGLPTDGTTCRHVELRRDYNGIYGHLCLAAVDETLVMQMTMAPFPEVPEEEVVDLLTAAMDKARSGDAA